MTQQELNKVGETWFNIARIHGKELTKGAMALLMQSVNDLPYEKVMAALNDWVRTSKFPRHPTPAEIREKIEPKLDFDAEAREAASRVVAAVTKFGYYQPEAAKQYIGELGWHAVKRWGGWEYICQNLGVTLEVGTFQAQVRDVTKATLLRNEYGMHDQAPAIESRKLEALTSGIGNGGQKLVGPKKEEEP